MKKSYYQLMVTAAKMANKYASVDANTILPEVKQSAETAIINASNVPSSGIMPFMKMIEQDQVSLSMTFTRTRNNITISGVSAWSGDVPADPQISAKYTNLPTQIKSYLERYPDVLPNIKNGEPVSYDGVTVSLEFKPTGQPGIASR